MLEMVRDEIRNLLRSPMSGLSTVEADHALATVDGGEAYPMVDGVPIPIMRDEIRNLLRSPMSGLSLVEADHALATADGGETYPIVDGVPILIVRDRSIVGQSVFATSAASEVERRERSGLARIAKRMLSPTKKETVENIAAFVSLLKASSDAPLVLVIGGGTEGQGTAKLYRDPAIRRVSCDIYRSPSIDFVADAHDLPMADDSVDGVLVQAVLEHVLEPAKVVAEIWRVLKPGGMVYSETPFLQQVHEGAYDFTRFTDSGHRFLFRRFERVASGTCGGAGTQLLWTLDYFFRGLFRSRAAGKAAKLMFFWLPFLDRAIPAKYTTDTASGFFFLGSKSEAAVSPHDIVGYYAGAQ